MSGSLIPSLYLFLHYNYYAVMLNFKDLTNEEQLMLRLCLFKIFQLSK